MSSLELCSKIVNNIIYKITINIHRYLHFSSKHQHPIAETISSLDILYPCVKVFKSNIYNNMTISCLLRQTSTISLLE